MKFCKECGSRLEPKKVKSENQVLLMLACVKCGKETKGSKEIKITGKAIAHNPKQMVSIIDKENQLSVLPTIQVACPKCGNNTVYAWQVQTRDADESSTQFLRCKLQTYLQRIHLNQVIRLVTVEAQSHHYLTFKLQYCCSERLT